MRSRTNINKRASYLVETAISTPVFMIAVIVMTSIIMMYYCIEDAGFIAARELRSAAARAEWFDTGSAEPYMIGMKIQGKHKQVGSFRVEEYQYRVQRSGIDELIQMRLQLHLRTANPLDLASEADYPLSLVTRAYVGRERELCPMSDERMAGSDDTAVFVFPARGERYHRRDCTFMTARVVTGYLSPGIERKYDPCPVCHSKRARTGALVYFFPIEGEAYHLPGCSVMKREYIEMEKSTAEKRGYTPCSKCGG